MLQWLSLGGKIWIIIIVFLVICNVLSNFSYNDYVLLEVFFFLISHFGAGKGVHIRKPSCQD